MKTGIDDYNNIFLSKTKMGFLKEAILEHLYPNPTDDESDLLKLIDSYMQRTINIIFYYAETNIEKLFLNSLFLRFSRESPYFMTFTNPLFPANEEIINVRKKIQDFTSSWKKLQSERGDITPESMMREINKLQDINEITKSEYIITFRSHLMFNLYNKLHLSMKSTFSDIYVGGQYFKADIFIWLPSNPEFKLIVDSDGFGSSLNKSAIYDINVRDHLLQAKGFQVYRLPGREIISDPVVKANEFYSYLVSQAR